MKRMIQLTVLGLGALAAAAFAQPAGADLPAETAARLAEQVRHELVMMPWYGVFDHLSFRLEGRKVTMLGEVRRPTLRDEAERRVKSLEGVEAVENRIHVLPLSPYDDRIRLASMQAIYAHPAFTRYGMGVPPAVHLLVENGRLTLKGVVATEADRALAGMLAQGVSGVFEVKNELAVEKPAARGRKG